MEQKKQHSVKVPRLYKVAASILKSHRNGGGSVKNLVYEAKRKHPNVKALFALVMECLQHDQDLRNIFQETKLLEKEVFDESLAEILVTELLWGKGSIQGNSRPVETVLKYEDKIRTVSLTTKPAKPLSSKPRYVRVNTLKNRLTRVVKHLKNEGCLEVMHDGAAYEDFLALADSLAGEQFMYDYHIANLLLFPSKTAFYAHPLFLDGSLVLQDKASCLPVQALDLPVGATVLDACAAPGMKTTQIAEAVSGGWNSVLAAVDPTVPPAPPGKVYAIERDAKRCQTLRKMLHTSGADVITTVQQKDFLQIDPTLYQDVQFIVLDPSCSGSGITDREGSSDLNPDRLRKLAGLQKRMLRHALTFPAVQKVSYSTCSVSEEENEKVVSEVMSDPEISARFELVSSFPRWQRRGLESYEHSECYIRSDPEVDLCIGFFVVVLQRKEENKTQSSKEKKVKKKKKKKHD